MQDEDAGRPYRKFLWIYPPTVSINNGAEVKLSGLPLVPQEVWLSHYVDLNFLLMLCCKLLPYCVNTFLWRLIVLISVGIWWLQACFFFGLPLFLFCWWNIRPCAWPLSAFVCWWCLSFSPKTPKALDDCLTFFKIRYVVPCYGSCGMLERNLIFLHVSSFFKCPRVLLIRSSVALLWYPSSLAEWVNLGS